VHQFTSIAGDYHHSEVGEKHIVQVIGEIAFLQVELFLQAFVW
jgi:hypothetical protein